MPWVYLRTGAREHFRPDGDDRTLCGRPIDELGHVPDGSRCDTCEKRYQRALIGEDSRYDRGDVAGGDAE